MRRDYHKWYSSRLGRDMELLAYGHSGLPVLVFPSSQGRYFEFENNGMIHELAGKIEWGHLQVFCVDSVDAESWYNRWIHPHDRVARHNAYESYIIHEVAPLMKDLAENSRYDSRLQFRRLSRSEFCDQASRLDQQLHCAQRIVRYAPVHERLLR